MVSSAEIAAINLRLALLGLPTVDSPEANSAGRLVEPIIARQRELSRRLSNKLCPADQRIQHFLDSYLGTSGQQPQLPNPTLILDEPGLARALSLPIDSDQHTSSFLHSYRIANGILHNPANDRRTTSGVFHLVEGGLPIPDDKIAVSTSVFAQLVKLAFQPPAEDLLLPITATQSNPANCFVSLLLHPLVVPETPGLESERRMETRFIVPGSLVANLDFVESIFGNGGDPYLTDNDLSLQPESWTGHTGMVILAPHLTRITKRELGLPHWNEASDRQRRDGQCWQEPDERYNNGKAFKICARDLRGVIFTIIADNYFGYCKKEVKTQISYSANLFGSVEEEHAGGALIYPAWNLGQTYTDTYSRQGYSVAEVIANNPGRFDLQPEGHALDRLWPHQVLVPAGATYSLRDMTISWRNPETTIPLQCDITYLGPDGYRVQVAKPAAQQTQWSLVGITPRSTAYHKPATVSGGGKSEVSKAITDAFVFGSAYTPDFDADLAAVSEVLRFDYTRRFADPNHKVDTRSILSEQRSLGSVIKLLTPSKSDFAPEYNEWLETIPQHVKELVFVVKRFYRPQWGADWRSHFSVDIINGRKGNSLRLDGQKIMVNMLRVGFKADGSWRLFSLRPDFYPGAKVQIEDDITASIVVKASVTGTKYSRKYVTNCEQLLFQRPDGAIQRGYDKQAEYDIAQPNTFLSNFAPLTRSDAQAMVADCVHFSRFTRPMADRISSFANASGSPKFVASSANPRLVDGKPSKNPRYLQQRPDLANPKQTASATLASQLINKLPVAQPLQLPIDVVAAGRRNNPPEKGFAPLCAYGPLHYMELPELFMEFISSMTGKSPSTTGAGSEGAMTKGPFNALPEVYDLNAALLSFVLTGYDGWLSSAGYIGPNVRVDHDISLLVPEVFARMTPAERDASTLIANGCLEHIPDMKLAGRQIASSRLGYRITEHFARKYFGRVFMHPHLVFSPEMLRPELQEPTIFAESVEIIVATHQRVAQAYFDDHTADLACPPLRALLEIMAFGKTSDGLKLSDPALRKLFDRETVLSSKWYAERLIAKQTADINRAQHTVAAITDFLAKQSNQQAVNRMGLEQKLVKAQHLLEYYSNPEYYDHLIGTLGRQPQFDITTS